MSNTLASRHKYKWRGEINETQEVLVDTSSQEPPGDGSEGLEEVEGLDSLFRG